MAEHKVLTTEPAGSPEWLKIHENYYGSNDVSTILGCNPHQSLIKLWGLKTGKIPRPDISRLPHIRRGILLEPVVAKLFSAETGREILPTPGLVQHPTIDCVAVTPDGLTDGGKTVAEFKTVGMHVRKNWRDDLPLRVQVQGQAMCWVLGLAKVTFAAFCLDEEDLDEEDDSDEEYTDKTSDPLLLWADRDSRPDLFEIMGNEVVDFHENYVKKDIPPAPGGDLDTVKAIWKTAAPGQVCALAAEFEIAIMRDAELAKVMTAAKKEKDTLRASVLAEMKNAEYGVTPGGVIVRAKNEPRSSYVVEACSPRVLRRVKAVGA